MIQHPIPQNITTYQFRLIGDMTLKQFFVLLTGIVLAVIVYNTNLFFFIKWALILVFAVGGVAAAFLPIEERPLDQWLVAFIKAIYNPTLYLWKREFKKPDFLAYIPNTAATTQVSTPNEAEELIKRKRQGLKTFLQTLPQHPSLTKIEASETQTLKTFENLFSTNPPPFIPTPQPQTQAPPKHSAYPTFSPLSIPTTPPVTVADSRTPAQDNLPAPAAQPTPPQLKPKDISHKNPTPPPQYHQVSVIPTNAIHIETTTPQEASPTPATPTTVYQAEPQPQATNPTIPKGKPQPTQAATTDTTLPFPKPPDTPNLVVGMVLDGRGQIVSGAIVEIQDTNHLPVRATKTNKLGQFFMSTPLKPSTYTVIVEKEGLTFTPESLEAKNKIIPPLKLTAQT